ncbi:MAG: hypothetical protein WBB25_01970 [Sulfitobacter sp.]
MSDPVKNAEVEDVLSSIRRLVSEDKRPLQTPKPAPAHDRLVLTPALRVEDKEIDRTASDAPRSTSHLLLKPENIVDDAAALSDAGLSEGHDQSEDMSGTAADDHFDFHAFDTKANPDTAIGTAESAKVDEPAQQPAVDGKSAALSAKIAALETAIGDISDEWEPDGKSSDAYAGTEPHTMEWDDGDIDESAEAEMDAEEAAGVTFSHRAEAVREAMYEDEEMRGSDEKMFEDQGETPSESVAETIAEPAVQGVDALDSEEPADGFDLTADDQLLDEETLRDLVSEIVQSELQGALGERITRNVRRLVRREIHRALTARDLD